LVASTIIGLAASARVARQFPKMISKSSTGSRPPLRYVNQVGQEARALDVAQNCMPRPAFVRTFDDAWYVRHYVAAELRI
jgi:hypothetical protein